MLQALRSPRRRGFTRGGPRDLKRPESTEIYVFGIVIRVLEYVNTQAVHEYELRVKINETLRT